MNISSLHIFSSFRPRTKVSQFYVLSLSFVTFSQFPCFLFFVFKVKHCHQYDFHIHSPNFNLIDISFEKILHDHKYETIYMYELSTNINLKGWWCETKVRNGWIIKHLFTCAFRYMKSFTHDHEHSDICTVWHEYIHFTLIFILDGDHFHVQY